MLDSTVKLCSSKANCKHPEGPLLPATTEYFYPDKRRSSLRARCIACYAADRMAGRQKTNEYFASYREINRERLKLQQREYYARNKEKINEFDRRRNQQPQRHAQRRLHMRSWYEAKRDHVRDYHRRYRESHRENRKAQGERRRARIKGAFGHHTAADIREIYEYQGGHCAYCGITIYLDKPGDIHLDHMVPLSRNGTNLPDNLVLTCVRCNTSKKDHLIDEWVKIRGW